MASAKLVVACAFNEFRVAVISKVQLQSAAKTLKVSLKGSESRTKEMLRLNVAQALINREYIKIPANPS